MTHSSEEELFAFVHGWEPRPDHLDGCASCLETVGRLREERELLRRAEAPVTPPARILRLTRALPVALAAGALLGIVGLLTFRPPHGAWDIPGQATSGPTVEELTRTFLEGNEDDSEKARQAILRLGPSALYGISLVQQRSPEARRIEGLGTILLDLKKLAAGEPGRAAYAKLESTKCSLDMQGAPLGAALDYLQETTGVAFARDPMLPGTFEITLRVNDVKLSTLLGILCQRLGLEYEFRYGLMFLSKPDRLWAPPKGATPPRSLSKEEGEECRTHLAHLSSDSPELRDEAARALARVGAPVIPILEEGARSRDSEMAGRCRTLLEALRPARTAISREARWRLQKLDGDSLAAARKLETMTIDLAFENTGFSDILCFIRDFSGLNIVMECGLPSVTHTIKVKNGRLGQLLELLLLPNGLDLRVEDGVLRIFNPKEAR